MTLARTALAVNAAAAVAALTLVVVPPAQASTAGRCTPNSATQQSATGTYRLDRVGYVFTLSAPRADSRIDGRSRSTVTVVGMDRAGELWTLGRYRDVGAARTYRPKLDRQRPSSAYRAPRADVVVRRDSPVPLVPDIVSRCSFRLARA